MTGAILMKPIFGFWRTFIGEKENSGCSAVKKACVPANVHRIRNLQGLPPDFY